MLEQRIDRWKLEQQELGRQDGLRAGRQRGLREGEAGLLLRLLERKFGSLPAGVKERVSSADAEQLLVWGDRVLTATSLDEIFSVRP